MKLVRRLLIAFAVLIMSALVCLLVLHQDGSISTAIDIDASPQRVWQVLTATADYPSWNPMISQLNGELRVGNVIEFTAGRGSDSMTFHPRILSVRDAQELCWKGSVLMPGLFDGEHRFLLQRRGNQTHLVQSERFTGLLVGKLSRSILRDTASEMDAMNAALKKRAESMR